MDKVIELPICREDDVIPIQPFIVQTEEGEITFKPTVGKDLDETDEIFFSKKRRWKTLFDKIVKFLDDFYSPTSDNTTRGHDRIILTLMVGIVAFTLLVMFGVGHHYGFI